MTSFVNAVLTDLPDVSGFKYQKNLYDFISPVHKHEKRSMPWCSIPKLFLIFRRQLKNSLNKPGISRYWEEFGLWQKENVFQSYVAFHQFIMDHKMYMYWIGIVKLQTLKILRADRFILRRKYCSGPV